MTRVLIRLDADRAVGRGHLARCLPLARALVQHGASVSVAISANSPFLQDLEHEQVEVLLAPRWGPDKLEQAAAVHDVVVLDLHDVPAALIERLRHHGPVVGLSAVGSGIGHLDMLANPVGDAAVARVGRGPGGRPRVRSGHDAVIIDHARFAHVREAPRRPGAVLVALGGGSGHTDALRMVLDALSSQGDVHVTVCTVDSVAPTFPNVDVMPPPRDFPERVASTALLVCGLGATLLEAAALGTPCVVVPQSDTHREQARWLQQAGAEFFLVAEEPGEVAEACARVLTDDATAEALAAAGPRFARPEAVTEIAREILDLAARPPL